jgi:hypothetical protein
MLVVSHPIFHRRRRKIMVLTPLKATTWDRCAHVSGGGVICETASSCCRQTTGEHRACALFKMTIPLE